MNLTWVLPTSGRAGAIRSTVRKANELVKRGHHVRILYKRKPRTLRRLAGRVLTRIRYGAQADWIQEFAGESQGFDDLGECRFESGETVVAMGSWAALQIGALKGEFAARIHAMHGALPGTDPYLDEALALKLPKIVVASYLVDFVRERNGGEVLGVVPNGVDGSEYYPPKSEKGRDGVGTVFANTPAKDPATIFAVMAKLGSEFPSVPQYVFGARRKPKQLRNVSYFTLASVDKARELYGKSRVWICASASEGFGLPILEAMSCGCAVVSTDCGGPRDIIRDGENGYLVPVGDAEAIVEKAVRLLRDEELRVGIAGQGLVMAREYAWEKVSVRLEECILKAVGAR